MLPENIYVQLGEESTARDHPLSEYIFSTHLGAVTIR